MAVTIGTLTVSHLRAQPLGYSETDTIKGLVARRWSVEGLVRPSEWLALLQIFESWRQARREDPDSLVALSTGSTVAFSGSAAGYSWSNVPCWFTAAPAGEAIGAYIGISVELVDAAQQLAAWVRQQEQQVEIEEDSRPAYGTITLGQATLTLTEQPDGYAEGPALQRTASGKTWINGPLGVIKAKRITGYTTTSGWTALRQWYEGITSTAPIQGQYYPVQPPTMTKEIVLVDGIKTTRCVVQLELWEA
jgi:hypothetical protein